MQNGTYSWVHQEVKRNIQAREYSAEEGTREGNPEEIAGNAYLYIINKLKRNQCTQRRLGAGVNPTASKRRWRMLYLQLKIFSVSTCDPTPTLRSVSWLTTIRRPVFSGVCRKS